MNTLNINGHKCFSILHSWLCAVGLFHFSLPKVNPFLQPHKFESALVIYLDQQHVAEVKLCKFQSLGLKGLVNAPPPSWIIVLDHLVKKLRMKITWRWRSSILNEPSLPHLLAEELSSQSTKTWEIIICCCFMPLTFGGMCYVLLDKRYKNLSYVLY